jgi:hypothetical protein
MSDIQVPQSPPTQPGLLGPAPAKGSNGLATAGFVLGLLGLLASWIPVLNIVGLILGVLGAVLAAVGLAKSKKVGAGKGLAIAGIVLGVLAVIIAIIVNVAFVNAVDEAVKTTTDTSVQAPAGSTDAAPSNGAAAEEKLGTSRDNPAPVGSAITGGDWTVKINSVKTANKDSMGQKPAAGKTLLVVNLTATYNGDDAQGSSTFATVKFVTAQGNTVDSISGSTLFVPEDQFSSLETAFKGASVTGNQIIEVPADGWENGVLSVSPDMLADDTFVAVK